jgi:hypothetical protein
VLKASSFENMSEATSSTKDQSGEALSRFANGGKSGGWSAKFSREQSMKMDSLYNEAINEDLTPGLKFDFGFDPYKE